MERTWIAKEEGGSEIECGGEVREEGGIREVNCVTGG